MQDDPVLPEIIHILFLLLPWEQRQIAKSMMKPEQKKALEEVLQGEPNW